ncbi:MliC family protein [[Mycobacterium] fortunisiensis]|nr:MliC family protein [[Mycobacterium] fortunisiensis]
MRHLSLLPILVTSVLTVAACGSTTDDGDKSETAAPTASAIDCAQPAGDVETQVCADPALADLDQRLARTYQQSVGETGLDSYQLRRTQREWVSGRDKCVDSTDAHRCLLEAYQTRLVELQVAAKDDTAPTPVEYRCDSDKPVSGVFYTDIDPSAMVLTVGADKAILIQQVVASGIHYAREGVDYREHHGDITIDFHGSKMSCRAS